ncbi:bifunctional transcriptional activator/DNA repair enzyme AdaA [Peribacillus kribbensis]|uniref:bifunctional transcriptional activator/DNA repair enzyme AdaA n=1 Tax=Peribacillus kribbensis TaxID=356658 RepID=UPI00041E8629|nr:Ada metal-binding domain-containing protein [Peribacillus kribbensis]
MSEINLSFEEKWQKILACDEMYDGLFYTAVKTTRIYCRPSCKSRKPKKVNVEFYNEIKEAEAAGYRPCKRCQPELELSPQDEMVRKAISYMAGHYQKRITLQDIAEHTGMSTYYFERLFKQKTLETPRSYLERFRIDKAKGLLRSTEKSNLEICYEAGFQSPSNFYKVFRRFNDCSPTQFRSVKTE